MAAFGNDIDLSYVIIFWLIIWQYMYIISSNINLVFNISTRSIDCIGIFNNNVIKYGAHVDNTNLTVTNLGHFCQFSMG